MSSGTPIFLITGPPGAGKTTVARALLQHHPFGLHIPVDDLREWVVSGIAHPVPQWTAETSRQFRLARQAAAQITRLYAGAGFAVAWDDIIFPAELQELRAGPLAGLDVRPILLLPELETLLARNRDRTNKHFDTAILNEVIRGLYRSFVSLDRAIGWLVVDSSRQTVKQTVATILAASSQPALAEIPQRR